MLRVLKSFFILRSLRTQFITMLFLILLVSGLLVLLSNVYQYQAQQENYHFDRLNRKESQIVRQIAYLVKKNNLVKKNDSLWQSLSMDFSQINEIHNVRYSLYNLQGETIFTYYAPLEVAANDYKLPEDLIQRLMDHPENRIIENESDDIEKFTASYRILKDDRDVAYAILFYPYFSDIDIAENEVNIFLQRMYQIYLILFIGVAILAFFLARYVTRSIEAVRTKIAGTDLLSMNEKIEIKNAPGEISGLINAYNSMIDKLVESSQLLVDKEKDLAWREMARQVAHEIKNALTPMKLAVQHFNQKFNPKDKHWKQRLREFANTLVEQIESMVEVSDAFSDYTIHSNIDRRERDLIEHARNVINTFTHIDIKFYSNRDVILYSLDFNKWTRVLNNLIVNAEQSIPSDRVPEIKIYFTKKVDKIEVEVRDNGCGIDYRNKEEIFHPKFTTKSSGLGLGLGIVKNIVVSHGGKVTYDSIADVGTTFRIVFPLEEQRLKLR